ncbi:MAG: hypothetical protein E7Z85_07490 [Methanosphaera stadtmanae]|jgi:hypothetical protein|nr:hypothetical protein [Methanosphaera stadtmanae]
MIFDKAEDINTMINSFDFPTIISPDVKNGNEEYDIISMEYSSNIRELKNKYDLTSDKTRRNF